MPAESPGAFARRYAKSWVHAVATALMTAFGTLTFVDPGFAALALAAYVLPPLALYLTGEPDEEAPGGAGDRFGAGRGDWVAVTVPTARALRDVTTVDGAALAVGDGGVVLGEDGGGGWRTLVADGPSADGTDLTAVDAAPGTGAWAVGDGGTVARIDPGTGRLVDHGPPAGDTNDLVAVAVAAVDDGELVLVADGSGRVRRGDRRDGDVDWHQPATPGGGSSVAGLSLADADRGVVCDTSQRVFETADRGRTYRERDVGDVAGTLSDVAAAGDRTVACADDGTVLEERGGAWTAVRPTDAGLCALAGHADAWVACGTDGTVVERTTDGAWTVVETPTVAELDGVTVDADRAIAVGDGGLVLERTSR